MADDNDSRKPTPFQLWFEEAWHGWLRIVAIMLALAAAYLSYKYDLVSEGYAGLVVVSAVLLGSLYLAAGLLWPRVKERSPTLKGAFVIMCIGWGLGTVYPCVHAVWPGKAVAEIQLRSGLLTNVATPGVSGPFEVTVSGHFKSAGFSEAEASYNIDAVSDDDKESFSGTLKRTVMQLRTSRRGGSTTSLAERTENTHRLGKVHGKSITFSTESLDQQLGEDGLRLSLRQAGPPPWLFLGLAILGLLLALGIDVKMYQPKAPTYLTVASATALVFSIMLPQNATPHALVRPAVEALVIGLVIGGFGGWLVFQVARLATGKKRK